MIMCIAFCKGMNAQVVVSPEVMQQYIDKLNDPNTSIEEKKKLNDELQQLYQQQTQYYTNYANQTTQSFKQEGCDGGLLKDTISVMFDFTQTYFTSFDGGDGKPLTENLSANVHGSGKVIGCVGADEIHISYTNGKTNDGSHMEVSGGAQLQSVCTGYDVQANTQGTVVADNFNFIFNMLNKKADSNFGAGLNQETTYTGKNPLGFACGHAISDLGPSDGETDDGHFTSSLEPFNGGYVYTENYSDDTTITESGTISIKKGTATYKVYINCKPEPKYFAEIEPLDKDSFENYIPTGRSADGSDLEGNGIGVRIKVYMDKDKKILYTKPFTVKWNMHDITHYPGVAGNFPKYSESPDVTADFVFDKDQMNQPALYATVSDSEVVTATGKGEFAPLYILSFDYASYATLHATVTLEDGTEFLAAAYYNDGLNSLPIPYDKNDNKIADAWEKQVGILLQQHPLTWDEDNLPAKQASYGDGYTLFEEYRGFAVYNKKAINEDPKYFVTRFNPFQKDIFVFDPDDLFADYYEPDNISGLTWHYVSVENSQTQIIENDKLNFKSRWMNFNTPHNLWYYFQYCVVIRSEAGVNPYYTAPDGAATTFCEDEYNKNNHVVNPNTPDPFINPVQRHTETVIYLGVFHLVYDKIPDAAKAQAVLHAQIKVTVEHEIGHWLGIPHHHFSGNEDWKSGTVQYTDPFDTLGTHTYYVTYMNTIDGARDCVMRYQNDVESSDLNELLHPGDHYCKAGESGEWYQLLYPGWDKVKKKFIGNVVTLLKGTYATQDDCYNQINIKTNPE